MFVLLTKMFERRFTTQMQVHLGHLKLSRPLDELVEQFKAAYEEVATTLGDELQKLQRGPEEEVRAYVAFHHYTNRMAEVCNDSFEIPKGEISGGGENHLIRLCRDHLIRLCQVLQQDQQNRQEKLRRRGLKNGRRENLETSITKITDQTDPNM